MSSVDLARAIYLRLWLLLLIGVPILSLGVILSLYVAILLSISVLLRVVAVSLLFHNWSIVPIWSVCWEVLHSRSSWLVHGRDPVDGTILATRVGAVSPRTGTLGAASVNGVVGRMLAMFIRPTLTVGLRIGLHAVAIPCSIWWSTVAAVGTSVWLVAVVATTALSVTVWVRTVFIAWMAIVGD